MIKYVFFDIDDTLLDFPWAERSALQRTYAALGISLTEEMYARYHQVNRKLWQDNERGDITREELLVRRHGTMIEEYHFSGTPQEFERLYRSNLGIGYRFVPNAMEILSYLSPKYRLFAASNGVAETQYPRLKASGLDRYFEQVFISEELGALKPQLAFFQAAFEKIPGFSRDNAILIGDSLSSDILGGIQAGIQTVWLNPNKKAGRENLHADYEICDLLELKDIL